MPTELHARLLPAKDAIWIFDAVEFGLALTAWGLAMILITLLIGVVPAP
jgi:hypothetical protein